MIIIIPRVIFWVGQAGKGGGLTGHAYLAFLFLWYLCIGIASAGRDKASVVGSPRERAGKARDTGRDPDSLTD